MDIISCDGTQQLLGSGFIKNVIGNYIYIP